MDENVIEKARDLYKNNMDKRSAAIKAINENCTVEDLTKIYTIFDITLEYLIDYIVGRI